MEYCPADARESGSTGHHHSVGKIVASQSKGLKKVVSLHDGRSSERCHYLCP